MRVFIKRNEQTFGPYPPPTLQLYLEQGSILPQDLAKLDSEPDTAWRPLGKLMRQHQIVSPMLSGTFDPARVLGEIRSFQIEFLFPWKDIQSGKWLKDHRVLSFVAVGMLPVVFVSLSPSKTAVYWCLALYFASIWSMYFYQMFRTPEVNVKTALICFAATIFAGMPIVLIVQQSPPMSFLYAMAKSSNLVARFLGMFLGVGISEELCLRMTSLPFLHAVWAGISAYFISFSMIVPSKRLGLRTVAILIPAFFHGLYNTAVSTPGAQLAGPLAATVSVFFLISYLASVKEFKSQLASLIRTP